MLKGKNKTPKDILPFVAQYRPSVSNLKQALLTKWHLIQNQPLLRQIFKETPIISCKKGKSLTDLLVRPKLKKVHTGRESVWPVTPCFFLSEWAAYYQTSRRSWYPKPEETIPFSRVPTIKPLPVAEMSQGDCDLLRNWASSYGAIYQRQCVTSDKPITFALGQNDERLDNVEVDDEEIEDDFDSSSDEEVADEDGNGGDSFLQGDIGSSATFLIGARSRFGGVVRIKNRFFC